MRGRQEERGGKSWARLSPRRRTASRWRRERRLGTSGSRWTVSREATARSPGDGAAGVSNPGSEATPTVDFNHQLHLFLDDLALCLCRSTRTRSPQARLTTHLPAMHLQLRRPLEFYAKKSRLPGLLRCDRLRGRWREERPRLCRKTHPADGSISTLLPPPIPQPATLTQTRRSILAPRSTAGLGNTNVRRPRASPPRQGVFFCLDAPHAAAANLRPRGAAGTSGPRSGDVALHRPPPSKSMNGGEREKGPVA
ncbi:hypothetical protein GN956_G22503 [Arapaima gigas]